MTERQTRSHQLLGGNSPAQFLKTYWQKKPLLIRGAFPAFRDPVTPEELAGLSCEEDVESRLVMERGGSRPWQVTHGPQQAARLRRLPKSHWTLLVQGVDRWIPGVAELLDPFRFIPDWRVDDVMISFAPRGGTVGPHIDSYDVFLIQGLGRRRWRIDSRAPAALRPGLDLRVLKQFHAEADWILEPGDMLYLPPDLAHFGTALENCLTYSIGFRSPSAMELLAAAQERLMQEKTASIRYRDPGLRRPRFTGEIPRAAMRELRALMEQTLHRMDVRAFEVMVGEFLTAPKDDSGLTPKPVPESLLRQRLKKGAAVARSAGSRIGFLKAKKGVILFVNGKSMPLDAPLAFAAVLFTQQRRFSSADLRSNLNKRGFLTLLATLIGSGAFYLDR